MGNNELERIWKEVVMAQLEVLSWNCCRGTEDNHSNPQVSLPRFIQDTF
jgi:hypothetical protein